MSGSVFGRGLQVQELLIKQYKLMRQSESDRIIDALLMDFGNELPNDQGVIEIIANSNCHTWGFDDYQNLETWLEDTDEIGFSVNIQLSGEQEEDYFFHFDSVDLEVEGSATSENGNWYITDYKIINAEINYGAYDDYEEAILSNTDYFQTFSNEIARLRLLNNIHEEDLDVLKTLQKLIYVAAITCLETYLSDAFINKVLSSQDFLESFFANYDFKGKEIEKIQISKLFEYVNKSKEIAKAEMLSVTYHNLSKVKQIYEAVIKLDFPNFAAVASFISTRHDLVHRNGKTKKGEPVKVNKFIVDTVITEVENLIRNLNKKMERKTSPEIDSDDQPFGFENDFVGEDIPF